VWVLGGGVFLGWALGANDAANVFGTAVASRIVSFRTAATLCSLAVVAGALIQGQEGMHTLSTLTEQTLTTVLITTVCAAITVTLMIFMRLPISTSQAVVGAIVGTGLATRTLHAEGLIKIVACWLATPIAAMVVAFVMYQLIAFFLRVMPMSMLTRDKLLWMGLLIFGIYGSYALGANNVANATGVYSGMLPGVSDHMLAWIGGLGIASGVISFSRRSMMTVGSAIMTMDAFTSLVAVAALAMTVHGFAFLGVPVSTGQAIVGAILGTGLMRSPQNIRLAMVRHVATGWLITPIVALILSAAAYAIFCH
jgi:PiT family inorganic phosphate transporter